MEHIGKIITYLILAVNALFVGTMIGKRLQPLPQPENKSPLLQPGTCISDIPNGQPAFYRPLAIRQLSLCLITLYRFSDLFSTNTDLHTFQFRH